MTDQDMTLSRGDNIPGYHCHCYSACSRTFLEGSLESSRGALKDKTRAAVERNAAVLAF